MLLSAVAAGKSVLSPPAPVSQSMLLLPTPVGESMLLPPAPVRESRWAGTAKNARIVYRPVKMGRLVGWGGGLADQFGTSFCL